MIKIQPIVREIVMEELEAYAALINNYMNMSSYAYQIKPKVEGLAKKPVTITSLVVSLSRLRKEFKKDNILQSKIRFTIDTRAGIKEVVAYENDRTFSVNMGKPVFSHPDFPEKNVLLEGLDFSFVSMGNPHAVTFVKNLDAYDVSTLGPKIENDRIFRNKINVEFVEEKNKNEYKVNVWERGCGLTLACGTGATAVYAALRKYKNAPQELTIHLPGGKLYFSENKNGDIIMRGPAVSVFGGIVEI